MHPFPPRLLLTMATASLALLAGALYLQFVENMAPCPLCIMQRYGFVGVALFCIAAAVVPPTWKKPAAGLGLYCGHRMHLRISRQQMLRAIFIMLLVSGGSLLARALSQ